jgi:hypothetical protein
MQMPQGQGGYPHQGGYPQGGQGGYPQGGQGGYPQGGQGGYPQGGQGGYPQGGQGGTLPPGYPPMQQHGGPAASGPNKTVMLQPSEGVVSVARTGQAVQPAGTGAGQQGASTAFWIVSLVVGVAVGALAYVIVLQL